jgi:hypothetical protein
VSEHPADKALVVARALHHMAATVRQVRSDPTCNGPRHVMLSPEQADLLAVALVEQDWESFEDTYVDGQAELLAFVDEMLSPRAAVWVAHPPERIDDSSAKVGQHWLDRWWSVITRG